MLHRLRFSCVLGGVIYFKAYRYIVKYKLLVLNLAKKVLMLVGPEFEDLEVFAPLYRLIEEGYEVVVASPKGGVVEGKHGYTIQTVKISEVNPNEFIALVLPGGRGPERIRAFARDEAVRVVREIVDAGKPVPRFAMAHNY
jgi:PfpI peptidase. Cysteine peptidase. MEROPS family C56